MTLLTHLATLGLVLAARTSHAQGDSLTVYLLVNGPQSERYEVYYKGQLRLASPRGGKFVGHFALPSDPAWSATRVHALDLYVARPKLFGLVSQDVSLGIIFNPGYRYLVLYRDPGRKRSSPLTSHWSNEKPCFID